MTTQEIKDLVAAKIAGQGNQIDLGNALPEIIDALCDAIDSAPKAAVVTETLSSTPIDISEERFLELTAGPILKYDGKDYLICEDLQEIGGIVAIKDAVIGAIYTHKLAVDDTGILDACDRIVLYTDGSGVGHIYLWQQR